MYNNINEIPLAGTPEIIQARNEQLRKDLAIYATRPFLNGKERNDLGEYYSTWGINNMIALFSFDKSGHFLPELYSAPKEYLNMLYPIHEILEYDKCGTLVIDREQYTPELRNLSYFIYIVDAELYDEYKAVQGFRGATAPTFMFNRHGNDGVRIFKDYFALARHLRKQRQITYILGPRTAFYLRYYIHQIDIHTIADKYVWGKQDDSNVAMQVVESIKRHLAFNQHLSTDFNVNLTIDNYTMFRDLLKSKYIKADIPNVLEYNHSIHIDRYNKQVLSGDTFKLKKNKLKKYQTDNIYDYMHMRILGDYAVFYVWDTRTIVKIQLASDINMEDFTLANDNRMDLVCKANSDDNIRHICEELKDTYAIQMRD